MKRLITILSLILTLNSFSQTYILLNKDTLVITSSTTTKTGTGTYTYTYPETVWTSVMKAYKPPVIVDTIPPPPPPIDTTKRVYEGFGSAVTGGKGYPVVMCNALTEAALRTAIGAGNRIVKFGVTGTIKARLESLQNIQNLTIDGEGKIEINNGYAGDAFSFEGGGNIIITNLRVRNAGNDCIGIRCKNFVVDHCSFDKSGDGLVDITDNAENVTVQYCIFGTSVAGAMLIAYPGTKNISIHHNIFTAWERMPLIHNAVNYVPTVTDSLMCEFVNNTVWGPWTNAGSWIAYGGTGQFKNNYYSKAQNAIRVEHPECQTYCVGNAAKGGGVVGITDHAEWPIPIANRITLLPAFEAATILKNQAGCLPLDTYDKNILAKVIL